MCRRPAFAAGFAVVVFVVGQFVALRHEVEVRHVTCVEHGEQLEALTAAGEPDSGGQPHWIGVEDDGRGEHRECASARLLRTSTDAPDTTPTHGITRISIAAVELPPPVACARTVPVLLIAPKTSPPA